jgi:hypothetical protein
LVHTSKRRVANGNVIRAEDIETKFPRLLKTILKFAD